MDSLALRKKILLRRDALTPAEQHIHGLKIMDYIVKMEQFQSADTIFMYVSFRSEVQTIPLIKYILKCGKKLVLPVTLLEKKDLLPVVITDPERELAPGYCSIPEPMESIRKKQSLAPDTIDLIFLPGSVFDERGGRMGYGGGFYDRFVSQRAPQALRIGLAHEVQMVQEAPLQCHDELLDYIVTEERLVIGSR